MLSIAGFSLLTKDHTKSTGLQTRPYIHDKDTPLSHVCSVMDLTEICGVGQNGEFV